MRRDYQPPAAAPSTAPHQRAAGGGPSRSRRWKQVFPIAQYQISDMRGQQTRPEPRPLSEDGKSLFNRVHPSAPETEASPSPPPEVPSSPFAPVSPAACEASSSSSATTTSAPAAFPAPEHPPFPAPPLLTAPSAPPSKPPEEEASNGPPAPSSTDTLGPLTVSVLHALEPVPFSELRPLTNLNKPPPNWLQDDRRVLHAHNVGAPRVEGTEFLSSALAAAARLKEGTDPSDSDSTQSQESQEGGRYRTPLPRQIDMIAPADNLKKLLMASYDDAPLALTIHRIGASLVLEGEVAAARRKHPKQVQTRSLLSKFLYYSILAEQLDESLGAIKKKSHAIPLPARGQEEAFKQAPPWAGTAGAGRPGTPNPPCSRAFSRTLLWRFQDLNLLLGSNTLVMQMRDKSEVAVRMRDEPLSQIEALDYWLDNVMTNVPNVAICYHKEGVIQGYQLVSTKDLPSISEAARFDPKAVEEYCSSVLNWLKESCRHDTGSYLLVREKQSPVLQLYDLSELHQPADMEDPGERPFAYSVGMMCYRMGDRLLASREEQDRVEARGLLQKSVDILAENQAPGLIALVHEKIAQTYLPVEDPAALEFEDLERDSPPDARAGRKKKKRKSRRTSKASQHADSLPDPATAPNDPSRAGSLIAMDCRKDQALRALEHLDKGIRVLMKYSEDGIPDPVALRRMREGKVQCYLELARIHTLGLDIGEAVRCMDEAVGRLPQCDPGPPERPPPWPSEAGRSSPSLVHHPYGPDFAHATSPRSSDCELQPAQLHFQAFARRTKITLYHLMGDHHYSIGTQLEQLGTEAHAFVQEQERFIRELRAQRKASLEAWASSRHVLDPDALFREYLPLSRDARKCFEACVRLYDQAAALCDSPREILDLSRKKGWARNEIAKTVMATGDLPQAQALFQASLRTWQELGDVVNQVLTLNNLGRLEHAFAAQEQQANSRAEAASPPPSARDDPLPPDPNPRAGLVSPPRSVSPDPPDLETPENLRKPHSTADPRLGAESEGGGEVEDPMNALAPSTGTEGPVLLSLPPCASAGNMSVHEENLRYSAIKYFNEAASLLKHSDAPSLAANTGSLQSVTHGNLAFAYFELAARLKQNFLALFTSKKDVETAIADLFLRAITLYEIAGQPDKMAFSQCYVASLYFAAWQHKYVPAGSTAVLTQLNDRRFKLSELYYRKALAYYTGSIQEVKQPLQLTNMMPRVLCALAELYRFAYISGGARGNLEKALMMLQHCKPWFVLAFKLLDDPASRAWSPRIPASMPTTPTEDPNATPEVRHVRALITEHSGQVLKHVKDDLMLFLKANRPTANEYQQAKVAYQLALKSNDILQVLDSVQRIKGKTMMAGPKGKAGFPNF